tara:strand:- start:485 stop:760 length:276 start_codon:yes stop_codon:yes gene_type:complete
MDAKLAMQCSGAFQVALVEGIKLGKQDIAHFAVFRVENFVKAFIRGRFSDALRHSTIAFLPNHFALHGFATSAPATANVAAMRRMVNCNVR